MVKKLSPSEREALLIGLSRQLLAGDISAGSVLRQLRKDVLDMNQADYAALVKISRRTLSDIENDTGSQTLPLMNSVFKPFGLTWGLLPKNVDLLKAVVATENGD